MRVKLNNLFECTVGVWVSMAVRGLEQSPRSRKVSFHIHVRMQKKTCGWINDPMTPDNRLHHGKNIPPTFLYRRDLNTNWSINEGEACNSNESPYFFSPMSVYYDLVSVPWAGLLQAPKTSFFYRFRFHGSYNNIIIIIINSKVLFSVLKDALT